MTQLKRRTFIVTLAALCFLCFTLFISGLSFFYRPVISESSGLRFTIAEGASIKSVVNELSSLDVIKHPIFFTLLAHLKSNKHELKAGDYLFRKGATSSDILKQITTGTGMFHYTFTIIAGWNFKHLREVLAREADLQHTSTTLSDTAIMAYLGHPEWSPEGRFYPDTYFFAKGSSDLLLLKRAFQKMQTQFDDAWKTRDLDLPYHTQNEALTVASLVEKETALDKERPIIAGVIVNRLRSNMLLQIDPTVIYAAGTHYDGTIRKTDLLIDSPYNTYKYKGLPPTPIAIPSKASLQAALHPEHHGYYYFVAKERNAREGHQFSATLTEHNAAVTIVRQEEAHTSYINDGLLRYYFLKKFSFPSSYNLSREQILGVVR